MDLPNIRCNHYTDDGQGHCKKGSQCTFTHPDSPVWSSARRRGLPFAQAKRARSPTRTSSSTAWATDAWGGTPADASASTWADFGSSSKESDSWKGGWSSSSNSETWAGWGDSSKPQENSSNNASSSGWGAGWSTGNTDKADNQVRGSNEDMPSGGQSNSWAVDKEKSSSEPKPVPKPRNMDESSKQHRHSLSRLNTEMPPPPPPTVSRALKLSQGAITSAIPPSPVAPSPIIGSPYIIPPLQNSFLSRELSFSQIIKSLVLITQIKVQCAEAKNLHERWKHVTESKSYQRVRRSGGQRLNDIRATYSTDARKLFLSVQANETILARLPDPLDSPRSDIDVKKFIDSMRTYKAEILDYINAVERLRAAKAAKAQKHVEEAPTIESQLQTLTQRLENLQTCMDSVLVELEEQFGTWDTEKFLDESQSIQDIAKNGDDKLSTVKAKLAILEEKFKSVDGRFNRHVEDEEALIRQRNVQNKALDELRQQKAANMKIKAEIEELLKQAEVAQERRKAKIVQLSSIVQGLYTTHEAPRQAITLSPPPLDNLQSTVDLLLQRDLVPLLDALMVEFKAALQRSEQCVQRKLQAKMDPILHTTQLILSRAKQTTQ